jgi:hypothetical protein
MATNFERLEAMAENRLENRIQAVELRARGHGKRLDTSLEGAYIGTVFGRLSLANGPVHLYHRGFLHQPANFVPKLLYQSWESSDHLSVKVLPQTAEGGTLSNQGNRYWVCILLVLTKCLLYTYVLKRYCISKRGNALLCVIQKYTKLANFTYKHSMIFIASDFSSLLSTMLDFKKSACQIKGTAGACSIR